MKTKSGTIRQILLFLTVNIASTAGVFAWMIAGAGDSMAAVFLMMWTPALSAFITISVTGDRLSSLRWRPGKARYLLESYSLPIAVGAIAYGFVWITGLAGFSVESVVTYRWAAMLGLELPVHPLVGIGAKILWGFLLFIFFIIGEEIGWSGFLVPRLLEVTTVPVTSLIVGAYWTAWHLPAFFGGLYGSGAPLWIALPGVAGVFIAVSLMRTILVAKSGSLWSGTLLHLSHNAILVGVFFDLTIHTETARVLVSETGLVTAAAYLAVAIGYWRLNRSTQPEVRKLAEGGGGA